MLRISRTATITKNKQLAASLKGVADHACKALYLLQGRTDKLFLGSHGTT